MELVVSIIIPVYNTPIDYFEKCISSIIDSGDYPYEIIVVDDGSEKNNSNKYEAICSKSEKIKYYYKLNGGVSSARNFGVSKSKGDYITFVDSDDIVLKQFLEEAFYWVTKSKSDVIIGNVKMNTQDLILPKDMREIQLNKGNIKELKKCFLEIPQPLIPYTIKGYPVGRLFKKSIFEKIQFPEQISYLEDEVFNRMVFDIIETAIITPSIWYIYNINSFSATRSIKAGNYIKDFMPFWEMWNKMNEQEDDDIKVLVQKRSMAWFYSAINDIVVQENVAYRDRIKSINKLYEYDIFKNMVERMNINHIHSVYEKFKFILIKNKMKNFLFIMVWANRLIKGYN